jgi:hypothetical protein
MCEDLISYSGIRLKWVLKGQRQPKVIQELVMDKVALRHVNVSVGPAKYNSTNSPSAAGTIGPHVAAVPRDPASPYS